MKKIFLYLFSIIFLFSTQLNAIEKKILTDAEWNEKINSLKWYNDDGKNTSIKVPGSNANLKIYENEMYLLGQDIDQYDWWAYGRSEGMDAIRVFSDSYSYTITKPENNGYVKIDDWSDVSPEELIQGLRDANKDKKERDCVDVGGVDVVDRCDVCPPPTLCTHAHEHTQTPCMRPFSTLP